MIARIELIALLDVASYSDVEQMIHDMKGDDFLNEMGDKESSILLIDTVIKEIPLIVRVDHEVWQSVDMTKSDIRQLYIKIDAASMDDDTYENLADRDAHVAALVEVITNNDWDCEVQPLPV